MILSDAFTNQKELFDATGVAPKSVVFMHANDTFGTSMQQGISAVMPRFNMPYKIVEQIAYDPTARDLSVEVAKAKATGAEALLMVSRLNDAILITRELVKQRWSPMAVLSMGPGWYEDQYLRSEEHTSELQSRQYLVCRLLLEKKKKRRYLSLTGYCYAAIVIAM